MASKPLAFAVLLVFMLSTVNAYILNDTREQMLAYYQTAIEPKLPATAKALLGDEKINVQIGGKTLGIETKRGEISRFGFSPVASPTIDVFVSDSAAEAIKGKRSGIIALIDNGEIRMRTSNFFTAIKVGMIERIYAISGADDLITGKKAPPIGIDSYSSIYVQRASIAG